MSFWMNIGKNWVICDMCNVQSYLTVWGERWILVMMLPKLWEKKEREDRNDVTRGGERKAISAIVLLRFLLPNKFVLWQYHCRIGEKKKKKNLTIAMQVPK